MSDCLACDPYWFPVQKNPKCFFCKRHIKTDSQIQEERKAEVAKNAVVVDKIWQRIEEGKRQLALQKKSSADVRGHNSPQALIQEKIRQATMAADVRWGECTQVCCKCCTTSFRHPYKAYGRSINYKVSYKVCKCKAIINPYTDTILARTNQPIENWINVYSATKANMPIHKISKVYLINRISIRQIQKKLKLAKQTDIDFIEGMKAKLVMK